VVKPQTDGSIVFARWRQCALPWRHIGATWQHLCFVRPTGAHNPNGKSIDSAIFWRPFLKQFALSYRTVVSLSCLSVCLSVCLWHWCILAKRFDGLGCHLVSWPNGWTNHNAIGTEVCLGPGDNLLDENRDVNKTFSSRPRPRSRPRLLFQDQDQDQDSRNFPRPRPSLFRQDQDQDQDLYTVSDNLAKDS